MRKSESMVRHVEYPVKTAHMASLPLCFTPRQCPLYKHTLAAPYKSSQSMHQWSSYKSCRSSTIIAVVKCNWAAVQKSSCLSCTYMYHLRTCRSSVPKGLQESGTAQNAVTYTAYGTQKHTGHRRQHRKQWSREAKYLNLSPVGSGLAELPAAWNAVEACQFIHVAHQVTLLLRQYCIKGCHNEGCPILKNLQ